MTLCNITIYRYDRLLCEFYTGCLKGNAYRLNSEIEPLITLVSWQQMALVTGMGNAVNQLRYEPNLRLVRDLSHLTPLQPQFRYIT